MPYNPGISYRGEILGQSIGAAGQSIAQSYGQGLQLREEQKRYDDVMKQRRRDRKNLKKSYGMQAELLGVDKEDIDTMGLGELQGLVEGTKLKSSLDFQGLQLQQLQGDIEQTAAGKRAVGQMQMYIEEQNLSPVDAATNAARDEGLELGEAAKLLNLATAGEKLGLELRTILARERGLDVQEAGHRISERAVKVQEKQQKRSKKKGKKPVTATSVDVPNLPGHKLVTIGDKSELVKVDEEEEIPVTGQLTHDQVDQVLDELQKLKDKGETHGRVSKSGIVSKPSWKANDEPIGELKQKYRMMVDHDKIRKDAAEAIKQGADPAAVRKTVKEQYGIDL